MNRTLTLLTALLTSNLALADEAGDAPLEPPTPPPQLTAPAPDPVSVVSDRSIGVHVAVHIGLFAVDAQAGHFYGFAAGNLGMPLVTDGRTGFGMIGAGYSFALSPPSESMWFMDALFLATAGRVGDQALLGGGVGVGFRYLHRSGFTFGAKLPVFGATAQLSSSTPGGYSGAAALGNFYLANLVSLPAVTFGYRF